MTAQERLQNARASFMEGRYADALTDHIWFHEHALSEQPALAAVRLSYGLDYWTELGEQYPPARAALMAIRDKTIAALLSSEAGGLSAFREVTAINVYLNEISSTYSLYQKLIHEHPNLARACIQTALPSIVEVEDYQLAARLAPDVESWIRDETRWLNRETRMPKHRSHSRAPTRWALVVGYVEYVEHLLKIKLGNGECLEAARLKTLAIDRIENPSLRRQVLARFVKRPRPPVPHRRRHPLK